MPLGASRTPREGVRRDADLAQEVPDTGRLPGRVHDHASQLVATGPPADHDDAVPGLDREVGDQVDPLFRVHLLELDGQAVEERIVPRHAVKDARPFRVQAVGLHGAAARSLLLEAVVFDPAAVSALAGRDQVGADLGRVDDGPIAACLGQVFGQDESRARSWHFADLLATSLRRSAPLGTALLIRFVQCLHVLPRGDDFRVPDFQRDAPRTRSQRDEQGARHPDPGPPRP
jgi:hypothetical protein